MNLLKNIHRKVDIIDKAMDNFWNRYKNSKSKWKPEWENTMSEIKQFFK